MSIQKNSKDLLDVDTETPEAAAAYLDDELVQILFALEKVRFKHETKVEALNRLAKASPPGFDTAGLMAIGGACVGWALETPGCHLCGRRAGGDHDPQCPVGRYLERTDKVPDTEPGT